MNISKTIKQKRLLSLFILLVLFLYVFYFSANTLWLEDDANYMFKFVINDTPTITNTSDEYISSLSDVIESQYAHYFVSNGRIVAHTIVQLINPFLSRSVFALFNGLAYVLFVLLIIKLGLSLRNNSRTRTSSVFSHPLAVGFVALMTQFSLMLKFTPSTAMYIWMYDLVLSYLLLLLFYKPKSQLWAMLLFPFAILVGNAHESINIGLALGLFIYGIRNITRLSLNDYAMLIGFAIGVVLIVLSPGSQNKVDEIGFSFSFIFTLFLSIKATLLLIALLLITIKSNRTTLKMFYNKHSLFIDALLGCLLFCFLLRIPICRAYYGAEVLSLALIISIWSGQIKKHTIYFSLVLVSFVVLFQSIIYASSMYKRIDSYKQIKELYVNSKTGEVLYEFPYGKDYIQRFFRSFIFPYSPPNMNPHELTCEHDRYVIQTFQKTLNHEFGSNKQLKFSTPISQAIYCLPDSNQVIESVPGNYHIITRKSNPPVEIIVHRSIAGIFKWRDYVIRPALASPDFSTDSLAAYSVFDQMMFVGIDSVSIN